MVDEIVKGMFELNILTNNYLLYPSELAQIQWQSKYGSIARSLGTLEFTNPEKTGIGERLHQGHAGMNVIFSRLVSNCASHQGEHSKTAGLTEPEKRCIGKLLGKSQAMASHAFQLVTASHTEVMATQQWANVLVLTFIAILIGVIGAMSWLISRSVLQPSARLQQGTEIIGAGDWDYTVGTTAQDEIGQLSRAFDRMTESIKQRTSALKIANQELEAFSYSVSHDLRAPLRAIDGFSRTLLDEHASHLKAEAARYLHLIHESAQEMGELIENLLRFSHLSLQPLHKQTVAPADLVRQALTGFRDTNEKRRVDIAIGELPAYQADPRLLKQVFVNLLANALKFTRTRETARIEVGCDQGGSEQVYFVRDNGAGFERSHVLLYPAGGHDVWLSTLLKSCSSKTTRRIWN